MKVRYTPRAAANLSDIYDYLEDAAQNRRDTSNS